ncbi:MAG: hypothetical protein ACRCWL_08940, partial [Aeromonas sp.]
ALAKANAMAAEILLFLSMGVSFLVVYCLLPDTALFGAMCKAYQSLAGSVNGVGGQHTATANKRSMLLTNG